MTEPPASEVSYWRSARAVRDTAETVFARAAQGKLAHFTVEMDALGALAARVVAIARDAYPDLRAVPVHGRYRHLGDARLRHLEAGIASLSSEAKLAARADVVITSVLLDAGAGADWRYRDPHTGRMVARSEALALASYDWMAAGGLSSEPRDPLRADAARLALVSADALGAAFQVRPDNPLVGLAGRASLLARLAATLNAHPRWFGGSSRRPGQLAVSLAQQASGGELGADTILEAILDAFADIWPGRERLGSVSLGDVWVHTDVGRVAFHKLSQWLAYSLFEPFEQAGLRIVRADALTGLAEYRNGGLFVDGGVLVPRHADATSAVHAVGSDLVIEWRALTVAFLDRIAVEIRSIAGLDASELSLARVLEAGTWRAGRVLARERRLDGSPPIRVESDGTVF